MRMRKKKNLISRMEACRDLLVREPAAQRGNWRAKKTDAALVRLELGCGKGRFTAETAAAHPEDLYVAVERVPDAMVIAMERCKARGLTNVFFIDGDAARLSDYFAPDEVDVIYINFCDPWPSLKHARRRLTHEGFLRGYRRVLRDGGCIEFKTDNRDLFDWSQFQFPKAGFDLCQVTRDLHAHGICGVMTDYEEKFHAMGMPIHRCVGIKAALPDVPLTQGLSRRVSGWEIRPAAEDIQPVLALLARDPEYLALEGRPATEDSLREDLGKLPPRCTPEQKHVLALWKNGEPMGVLDLVEGYPREGTLFVGLLLVDPSLRRQGVGRMLASALCAAAAGAGFDRVRLACLKNNPAGCAFWQAAGFRILREGRTLAEGSPVWMMETLADREDADRG